jgi:hypothetical protein
MNRRSGLYRAGLMSGLGALVAAMALLAVPSPAAHATTPPCSDCWIVTPSANPVTVSAGTSETYSFTVTGNDPNETLEQLTFSAPSEFVITGVPLSPAYTMLSALPASSVTLTLPSNAGNSFHVEIMASAPCTAGSGTWSLSDRDSFDNNEADWSSSPLSVSVTGQCSLAFTGQPASTAVNTVITTSAFDPQGGPVTVEVLDGSDQLDTASSAEVSVAIAPNSGPGTLSGTVMVRASGGIASFPDLSINQPGGYTFIATSPGIPSGTTATSNTFTIIFGSSQPCSSSTCSASASSATTSGTVTASSAAAGDFIAASMGGVSYSCGGTYKPVSDVFGFAIFSAAGGPLSIPLTVTLNIDKSLVQSSGHPGASSWQICYASTSKFASLPNTSGSATIGGVTYNTGLLPDCSGTQGAPCVQHRNKGNAGNVIVTFLASGDPFGHG